MDRTKTGNAGIVETMDWVVLLALALQVPGALPLVWGRSGIGKTKIGRQIARLLVWAFFPIALNTRTPSDIQGAEIPNVSEPGRMEVVLPRFFQDARAATGGALVLFDEVGSLSDTMQGASLRILSERAIDSAEFGDHVRFYATANPPHIAAGAGEMPEAFSYRYAPHIRAAVNPSQVARYMRGQPTQADNFPILDLVAFRAALPAARATVADYQDANPSHVEETEEQTEGRWPLVGANPRSWEQVASFVAACNVTGRRDLLPPLVVGTIGAPVALPFLSYERTHDLAQPDSDPAAWTPDPARPDRDLAILAAVKVWSLSHDSGQPIDPARWLHGWAWVARAVECNARAIVAQLGRALADPANRPATLPRDPASIAAAKVAGTMIKTLAPILRHAGPAAG